MAEEATTEGTDVEATEQEAPEATEQDAGNDGGAADGFDADKALEKIRKLNSEAAGLRKRAKDAEEKAAGADEKDKRVTALEAEVRRVRIGAKHGLPEELIDRLRGDTEEEILADAEKLLALVSRKAPPSGKPAEQLRGGSDPTREVEETDADKIAARMFRR